MRSFWLVALGAFAACTPFADGSVAGTSSGGPIDGGPIVDGPDGGAIDAAPPPGDLLGASVSIGCADSKKPNVDDPQSGFVHVCVLRKGGIQCWGNGQFGQTGDSTLRTGQFVELTAGFDHTCARADGGKVSCWGYNFFGELGASTNVGMVAANFAPIEAGFNQPVLQLAAGYGHTCVTSTDGAWCWGRRNDGEFGDAQMQNLPSPVKVTNDAVRVAAGRKSTLVLDKSGDVYFTGESFGMFVRTFTKVSLFEKAARIAAGKGHACAILTDGNLWCWGSGANFGTGGTEPVPVRVGTSTKYLEVAASQHTCGLQLDRRTVDCFGPNDASQLGKGGKTVLPADVTSIAVGGQTTCATTALGDLHCWGRIGFMVPGTEVTPEPTKIVIDLP